MAQENDVADSPRFLHLESVAGIVVGQETIPTASLQRYLDGLKGGILFAGTYAHTWDHRTIFKELCAGSLPIQITGDSDQTLLEAQLAIFPYVLKSEREYKHSAFSLRFIPVVGQIAKVALNDESGMAVDDVIASPESFKADLGKGFVNLEVHYRRVPGLLLPPLEPPKRFSPVRYVENLPD